MDSAVGAVPTGSADQRETSAPLEDGAPIERRIAQTAQCIPIIALAVIVSVWSGRPAVGIAAIGGAVSVGFGPLQHFTRYRAAPMILAGLWMGISAFIGAMLARQSLFSTAIVLAVWGYTLGAAAVVHGGLWWICLQGFIALVVSYAYPVDAAQAGIRVALVLVGGLTQATFITAIWWMRGLPLIARNTPGAQPFPSMRKIPAMLSLQTPAGQYAYWVAIGVAVSGVTAIFIKLPNAYWVPLTAGIVIKSDIRSTLWRGMARLGGTLTAGAVVTLIVALTRPTAPWLGVMIVATVWLAYLTQKRNYTSFAAAMTAYVVLALSLAGLPEVNVAVNRAVATLIGAAFALFPHLLPVVSPKASSRRKKPLTPMT